MTQGQGDMGRAAMLRMFATRRAMRCATRLLWVLMFIAAPSARLWAASPSISGVVYADTNHSGSYASGEKWTSPVSSITAGYVYVHLYSSSGAYLRTAPLSSSNNNYSFTGLTSGATYRVVVSASSTPSLTSITPAGWMPMENASGSVTATASSSSTVNFGFFPGFTYSGQLFLDNGVGGGPAGAGIAGNGVQDGSEPAMPGVYMTATATGDLISTTDSEYTDSNGNFTFWFQGVATSLSIPCRQFTLGSYNGVSNMRMDYYTCPVGYAGAVNGSAGGSFYGSTATIQNSTAAQLSYGAIAGGQKVTGAYIAMQGGSVISGRIFIKANGDQSDYNSATDTAPPTSYYQNVTYYYNNGSTSTGVISSASDGTFSLTTPSGVYQARMVFPITQVADPTTGAAKYRVVIVSNPQSNCNASSYPTVPNGDTCIGDELTIPNTSYGEESGLSWWFNAQRLSTAQNGGVANQNIGLISVNTVTSLPAAPAVNDTSTYVYYGYKILTKSVGRIFLRATGGNNPEAYWAPCGSSLTWNSSLAYADLVKHGGGDITLNSSGLTQCAIVRDTIATSTTQPILMTAYFYYASAKNNPWVADTYTTTALSGGTIISGKVFLDNGAGTGAASNGVQDGAEPGVSGITVQVTYNYVGKSYTYTATTDASGSYSLSLPQGSANVVVTRVATSAYNGTGGNSPTGWTYTLGANGAADTFGYTAATTLPDTTVSGVNFGLQPNVSVAGTVFYDGGYNGGAGRSLASSGGAGVSGATVELWRLSSGSTYYYVKSATTDSNGAYKFSSLTSGATYIVRVVNSTVATTSGLLGVQSFRTNLGVADTARVGGEVPSVVDYGSVTSTSYYLSSSTAYINGSSSNIAQSIAPVGAITAPVTGVDFGFVYNAIVNTNDSGQGSLRQFINNANILGSQKSQFMISDGSAHNGLRSGLTSMVSSGVATISLNSALPTITASGVTIDGSTEASNVTSLATTVLSGVSTGVSGSLSSFTTPAVELDGSQYTLTSTGSSTTINALALYAVSLNVSGASTVVSNNLVGMKSSGSVATALTNVGIEIGSGSGISITHNYVKANNSGIRRDGGGSSLTISQNYVDNPGSQSLTFDGILLVGPGTMTGDVISQNYVTNMVGGGIEVGFGSSSSTVSGLVITNNTATYNGWSSTAHSAASFEAANIALWGVASGSSVTVSNNVISHAGGSGILLRAAYGVKITQNSISANGVGSSGYTGPGISLDSSTADPNSNSTPTAMLNTGAVNANLPNNGVNYPIFTKTTLDPTANKIHLKGYIGAASASAAFASATIELYKASSDGNQTALLYNGSAVSAQRGEGATYLGVITADATGAFDLTLDNSALGFANGDLITSTAYLSAYGTSEFSPNSTITLAATVSGNVFVDANHNGALDAGESWSSTTALTTTYYVNLLSGATVIGSAAIAPAASGAFTIQDVPAGAYTLIVASSATATSVAAPTGYVPTAPANETLSLTVAAKPAAITGENFGFYNGVSISGAVFIDDGAVSGVQGDGIKNGGEVGYTAASLTIGVSYTASGSTTTTSVATSATDGGYTVYLPAAATNVVLTRPFITGYRSTSATATPSGSYVSGFGVTSDTYTFASLSVGQAVVGPYFGVMPGYVVSGAVFIDNGAGAGVAANGVKDGAEAYYTAAAQTMQISYVASGASTATTTTTTTDASGAYRLNVPVGATSVVVSRLALSGYMGTGGTYGSSATKFAASGSPLTADPLTLGAVTASVSVNYGVANYSTVSGSVFVDNGAGTGGVAGDGIKNGTETGYTTSLSMGVSYMSTNATAATTTTVATSATDGTYKIYIPASVTNLILTRPVVAGYVGTGAAIASGATGAYASGGYGAADTLTISALASGATVSGPSFGIVGGAVISGAVFIDNGAGSGVAANGVKDGSEAYYTAAAQTIQLVYTPTGGAVTTLTQTTSAAGAFSFTIPANSTAVVVTRQVLSGYMGTGGTYGAGATKFAASGSPLTADPLTLGAVAASVSVNYGVANYSTVSGSVFVDNGAGTGGVAGDGIKNGAEAGYTTSLSMGVSYMSTNAPAATTTTVATSAADGTFKIYIPASVTNLILTRPAVAGYVGTGAAIASGATGAYASGGYGAADTLTISALASGATVSGPIFGVVMRSTVSGYIFIDNGVGSGTANNGVKDGAEAGSAVATPLSVSYTLKGATAATQSVTVASDGSYSFYLNGPATAITITRPAVAGYVGTGFSQSGSYFGSYTRGGAGAADTISLLSALPAGAAVSGVNMGLVPLNTLTAGTTQAGIGGSTLYYAHQFVAGSSGSVTFASTQDVSAYNVVVYRDTTNPSTCSSTYNAANFVVASSAVSVTQGQSLCLLIAVTAPSAPAAGDNVTLTSTMVYSNATPALTLSLPTAVDVFSLGTVGVTITKVANKTQAFPGETVLYTITLSNATGSLTATSLSISDATPEYTTFVSAACPASLPAGVTSCAVSTQPSVGGVGAVVWTFGGSMASGASLAVTMSVKID